MEVDTFFALDDEILKSLIKNEPNSFDFIVKYSFEKGRLVEKCREENSVELMELSDACYENNETITSTSSNFSAINLKNVLVKKLIHR